MKKLLSLLTVSILGITSITNVTAFNQAKTTYKNINSGTASKTKMSLQIQLNASAWSNFLVYKNHFNLVNKWGFGAYLLQYANDNEFHHTWGNFYMPDVPTAVAFDKSNIIEDYFGGFGEYSKSSVAESVFSNHKIVGKKLTNWYNKDLFNLKVTTAIKFYFIVSYNSSSSKYTINKNDYDVL